MHEVRGGRAERRHSGYSSCIDGHPLRGTSHGANTRETKYVSSEKLAAITAELKAANPTLSSK